MKIDFMKEELINTKINTFVIATIVLFTLFVICPGNSKANTTKNNDVNDLIKVMPKEYSKYKNQLTGRNDINDCNATLVLILEAKKLLDKPAKEGTSTKEERNSAYYATWRLCLRMRQESKDQAVQKRILEEWNNFLMKDDDTVPYQIYALTDRSLLTDDFWKLLKQTSRKKTISAICCMLYGVGNAADVKQLEQKRNSGINTELQEIIQNAINWMNYRLIGDKTNPGPAAAPPMMNMKNNF